MITNISCPAIPYNCGFNVSPVGRRHINGVSPSSANMAIFNPLPKFQLSIG